MGGSFWGDVGRVVAGVVTGGITEIANEASGGGVWGSDSTFITDSSEEETLAQATSATTTTQEGEDPNNGVKGDTAEGGEDIYNNGSLKKDKQKKSTLIGEGSSTFSLDENANLGV